MGVQETATVKFDKSDATNYSPDLYHYGHVASGVSGFEAVGDVEIEFYRQQGYLVINQAFSPDEVRDTLQGLLDLIDGKNPDFKGIQFERHARDKLSTLRIEEKQDYVRKLMGFVNYDHRLEALSEHPKLVTLLQRMIGEKRLNMFQDQALLKPPGGGREKPWHQDKAYFNLRVDSQVVGVWIALDEATPENGCMHIIPGSHLEGPMPHFNRRDWQICDTDVQTARDVVVPLKPGGCLLFDGLIHHGTPVNMTTTRRRAVQLHYTAADAIWGTPEERMAIYGSEGKDVTC